MAFLGLFGKKDKQNTTYSQPVSNQTNSSVKIDLVKEESLTKINLRKEQVSKICLEKKPLTNLISRVCLVLDYSVSMTIEYNEGIVQSVIERLLPIAMQFDDNQEMEIWIFEDSFHSLGTISLDNYYNYIENERILEKYTMGGTEYYPVMNNVIKFYKKENDKKTLPTLVLFITDGDNSYTDKPKVEKLMKKTCTLPIFWQFIGIGDNSKKFLEKLDDMKGREIDNANFFNISNIKEMTDEDLYKKLLTEYPTWLETIKNKNII